MSDYIATASDNDVTVTLLDGTGAAITDATVEVVLKSPAGATVAEATAIHGGSGVYVARLSAASLASANGVNYILTVTTTSASAGGGYGERMLMAQPQQI